MYNTLFLVAKPKDIEQHIIHTYYLRNLCEKELYKQSK